MNLGLIYIATSPDGLTYIGQTSRSLLERRKEHEMCSGSTPFAKALREAGTRNFKWQVIESGIDLSLLNEREQHYIKTLKPALNVSHARYKTNKFCRRSCVFLKPKMLAARIPEDLFFQFKTKLKENNVNVQTFVNSLIKSVNSGLIEGR